VNLEWLSRGSPRRSLPHIMKSKSSKNSERTSYFGLWCGAAYGLILTLFGFIAAGFGHGTYALLGIWSAPLSLLWAPFALFGAIALWAGVGLLLGSLVRSAQRVEFLIFISVHYAGAMVFLFTQEYSEWAYFLKAWERVPWTIMGGILTYFMGQVFMWLVFLRTSRGLP
jgi:hypothetical protein